MIDLQNATHHDFETCLNQVFRLHLDEAEIVELQLVEVELRGEVRPESERRQGFSLILQGGPEQPLPQGIYRIEHETLGRMELFLVPIERARYEAVFG